MDGAIGALVFFIVMGLITAVCFRNRESLSEWLNGDEKQESDPKLTELQKKVKADKIELNKYQTRLRLQADIKRATEKLENMDKAETGEQ